MWKYYKKRWSCKHEEESDYLFGQAAVWNMASNQQFSQNQNAHFQIRIIPGELRYAFNCVNSCLCLVSDVTEYISRTQCSCRFSAGILGTCSAFPGVFGYAPPAIGGKPGDIKDDNLLGIPLHFLIETRGVMDSGVERSTGPVCWGPSVGSCSVYAPSQEWKASVSRAILFS